jgi:hypothetical protein
VPITWRSDVHEHVLNVRVTNVAVRAKPEVVINVVFKFHWAESTLSRVVACIFLLRVNGVNRGTGCKVSVVQ